VCRLCRLDIPAPSTGDFGGSVNQSLSPIEPVSGMAKRKLEKGEQRLAPQNLGFGPEILKIRR